jgi:hypothetical protein
MFDNERVASPDMSVAVGIFWLCVMQFLCDYFCLSQCWMRTNGHLFLPFAFPCHSSLPCEAMVFLNLIDVLLVMTDGLYSCGAV